MQKQNPQSVTAVVQNCPSFQPSGIPTYSPSFGQHKII